MEKPDNSRELEMILKKFIREQNEHNRQVNFFMNSQSATTAKLIEDVEEIRRGVYGDKANEVVGLITKQSIFDTELKKVKLKLNRAFWWGSGVIAGLNVAIYFVKELFTHK